MIHLLSVFLGDAASWALPTFWIQLIAGLSFIAFGLWTLRGDKLDDDGQKTETRFGPLMTVAATFFLAELGDKTMLATITIASQYRSFVAVWLGSTVGMVLADGLAIIVGRVMGKQLPERAIKYGAAAAFILSGVFTLYKTWMRH
ncbi:MAG: TMEM165/GDT1 family protein [Chloracidobacterium sp.]|nr:TMEM165/GDT1 family protein [Chloracidobacterium sp.]